MNRKRIIMYYRTSRQLKGHRPAIVYLKQNIGKIYNEGQADFIMTITNNELVFQRLSFFTKKLLPKKDFTLNLERIKSYNLREVNLVTNCLTLYTVEKFFLEIFYNTKRADTYETEMHVSEIIKKLEARNVKAIGND